MNIFEEASQYTIDDNLKKILQLCSKNRPPPEFKISKGKIITSKGNTYDIPSEPIEVFNLVFNILNGIEIVPKVVTPTSTKRVLGINDDALYFFARKKSREYGYGNDYVDNLISCIYTAIYCESISQDDIRWNGEQIESIEGIDCKNIKIKK